VTVTKREIIVSIAIVALMFTFGFMIHGSINDALMLKYQKYNTALQINQDTAMFKYGMETNVGNSFIYGDLKCLDTVSYPEINGEYSYVKKVKEKYTRHTRTVTKTRTVNGKTQTYTEQETYWTWDEVYSESKHCTKIAFLGVEFSYGQIDFPSASYITTIKESSKIRYKYYGSPTECVGTLFSVLKDGTINDSSFYCNMTIDKTIERLESGVELILFWLGWLILTGGLVFAFIYVDNHWLEDKPKYRVKYHN
jgi:hypothetical protein